MAISLINTECKRYGCMKNLLACYANCRYSTRCDDLRNEVINNMDQASSDINKYLSERGKTPIVIQLMKRGLKFSEAASSEVRPGNKKQLPGPIKSSETEATGIKIKSIPRLAKRPAPGDKSANLSTKGIIKNRKGLPKLRAVRSSKSKEENVEVTTVKLGKSKGASYLDKPPAVLRKISVTVQKPQVRTSKKMIMRGDGRAQKLATDITKNRKSAAMPRKPGNESNATVIEKEQILNMPSQEQEGSANIKAMTTRPARSKKRSAATRGRSAERNGKVYLILEGKSANVVDEQGLMMHLFTNPSSNARYFEASEVQARVQIIKK